MLSAQRDQVVAQLQVGAASMRWKELDNVVMRYQSIIAVTSLAAGFSFAAMVHLEIPALCKKSPPPPPAPPADPPVPPALPPSPSPPVEPQHHEGSEPAEGSSEGEGEGGGGGHEGGGGAEGGGEHGGGGEGGGEGGGHEGEGGEGCHAESEHCREYFGLIDGMVHAFYIFTSLTLCFGLYVVAASTFAISAGYRLALQGAGADSVGRAVAVLLIEFRWIFWLSQACLVCILGAACTIVYIKLDDEYYFEEASSVIFGVGTIGIFAALYRLHYRMSIPPGQIVRGDVYIRAGAGNGLDVGAGGIQVQGGSSPPVADREADREADRQENKRQSNRGSAMATLFSNPLFGNGRDSSLTSLRADEWNAAAAKAESSTPRSPNSQCA